MTNKDKQISLAKLMIDKMGSGLVALGFKKTGDATTPVTPTKEDASQRFRTVITFERAYGIDPEDEGCSRTETITLTFTDASIKDAVDAYRQAGQNPVSVEEQEKLMGDDAFDTTILDNHQLQPAMDLLIGKFGAVYMPGSSSESESEFNAGLTLGLGRMLTEDGEDPEISGVLIEVAVDGPGNSN